MDIARAAQRCSIERARALVDLPSVGVRSGEFWLAVSSGTNSNDLNVVVSEPGFRPDPSLLTSLRQWFDDVPATWLLPDRDDELTATLSDAGWQPDRTGRWCGRKLLERPVVAGLDVVRLRDDRDIDDWLEVAMACGWCEDAQDRRFRVELLRAITCDDRRAAWVARLDGRTVGMASAWSDGATLEIVDVAVVEQSRRRGVGSALVSTGLAWGSDRGVAEVVAAPSPDGWQLFKAFGFINVAAEPDVCFYSSGV